MRERILRLNRRELIAGLGAVLAAPALPRGAMADASRGLALQAKPDSLALRPGQPATAIWSLTGGEGSGELRFKRGDTLQVQLGNATKAPTAVNWRGVDGVSASEPLLAPPALQPAGD